MATNEGTSADLIRVPDAAPVNSRVRLVRELANLEPEAVAVALGISVRSYYRRESGQAKFRRGELVLIAQLCCQDPKLFGVLQ